MLRLTVAIGVWTLSLGCSSSTTNEGTGGSSSGGANTGGANTGGASTGGANTGGASTGGSGTGGSSTGGSSTGGSSTGGSSTGGSSTGGSSTGGTGGATGGSGGTGGAATGGTGGGGLPPGSPCTLPTQCAIGTCSGGICCNQDCTGTCSQCNANGVGCTKKANDAACPGNGWCADTGVCGCANGVKDPGETGKDCGGNCLPLKCADGEGCNSGSPGAVNDANCVNGNCCNCPQVSWVCKPYSPDCAGQGCP